MKIFKGFNKEGSACPICGTKKDQPCTLIGISGTEEGRNMQAMAVHVECIDLLSYTMHHGETIIAQKFTQKGV
jgi:hypothetical protein